MANHEKTMIEDEVKEIALFSIQEQCYCVNIADVNYPSNMEDMALSMFEIIRNYTDDYETTLQDIKQSRHNMNALYDFQVEDDDTITFFLGKRQIITV